YIQTAVILRLFFLYIREKNMKKYSFFLIISFFLVCCYDKTFSNPTEVYQLWTGTKPSKQIKVINGQYWESGHWTKEYVLFLELQTVKSFWERFKKENNLIIDSFYNGIIISEKTEWFVPTENCIIYKL